LVVLDHVTSSTAVVLPIEKILTALEDKDVAVCVDGAQAPGMFELSLRELQPDFYLGDCHKWLSGPRGSGFVWVDEPHRSTFRPAIFGSGELGRQQLHHRFRANGTRDWTPFLCVPTAIEWLGQRRPGGWSDVYRENAATVGKAVARIGEQLGYEPVFFEEGRQSMAAFPLQAASVDGDYKALEKRLFEKHRVELAFKRHEAFGVIFRVSCHLYNDESDIEKGINALQTELT
jgi:isopenicillin-N epimerase